LNEKYNILANDFFKFLGAVHYNFVEETFLTFFGNFGRDPVILEKITFFFCCKNVEKENKF
jgi:hypothetical protein